MSRGQILRQTKAIEPRDESFPIHRNMALNASSTEESTADAWPEGIIVLIVTVLLSRRDNGWAVGKG